MARYPCEKVDSARESVTETTSVLPSRPPTLRKRFILRAFRVLSDTNTLVKNLFVFTLPIYALPYRNCYGAWVGFFVPAAEVIGTPSFEVALAGVGQRRPKMTAIARRLCETTGRQLARGAPFTSTPA